MKVQFIAVSAFVALAAAAPLSKRQDLGGLSVSILCAHLLSFTISLLSGRVTMLAVIK